MRQSTLIVFYFLSLSGFAYCKAAPESAGAAALATARARVVWANLSESRSHCGEYDYFPEGGLRNFACHVADFGTYAELARASGVSVFLSGPHDNQQLNLSSRTDFGRYNPRFVRFLIDHAIPAAADRGFYEETKFVWQASVAPLARVYLATYRKWQAHPELLQAERARYESLLASGNLPEADYERYYDFLRDSFGDEGRSGASDDGSSAADDFTGTGVYDGNVVKTAAAFWLRRHIDGTAELFYEGLEKAIRTYDPALLAAPPGDP